MTTPQPPFTKRMGLESLIEVCEEIHLDYGLTNRCAGKKGNFARIAYLEKPHLSKHKFVEAEGDTLTKALFAAMTAAWEAMDHTHDRAHEVTKKGGRKAAKITIDELRSLVEKALAGQEERLTSMTCLTPEIENDIRGKVSFDTENEEFNTAENWKPWDQLLGYRQWDDLVFLGGMSGGDWESPVFWLIYFDGKKLRGYVPKDGNTWNHKTKQALGNDEDADLKHAIAVGWINPEEYDDDEPMTFESHDVECDVDKIRQDVLNRIVMQ